MFRYSLICVCLELYSSDLIIGVFGAKLQHCLGFISTGVGVGGGETVWCWGLNTGLLHEKYVFSQFLQV